VEDERATAAGDDSRLRIRYASREVYLVMSPPEGGAATVGVSVDGERRSDVRVDANELYTVVEGDSFGAGELALDVPRGTSVYAFTFG
jgi:hypothetical protein